MLSVQLRLNYPIVTSTSLPTLSYYTDNIFLKFSESYNCVTAIFILNLLSLTLLIRTDITLTSLSMIELSIELLLSTKLLLLL